MVLTVGFGRTWKNGAAACKHKMNNHNGNLVSRYVTFFGRLHMYYKLLPISMTSTVSRPFLPTPLSPMQVKMVDGNTFTSMRVSSDCVTSSATIVVKIVHWPSSMPDASGASPIVEEVVSPVGPTVLQISFNSPFRLLVHIIWNK